MRGDEMCSDGWEDMVGFMRRVCVVGMVP
jgi:hypothetical protein